MAAVARHRPLSRDDAAMLGTLYAQSENAKSVNTIDGSAMRPRYRVAVRASVGAIRISSSR
jgi:hypothetical protein